jgi:hypothetical protein
LALLEGVFGLLLAAQELLEAHIHASLLFGVEMRSCNKEDMMTVRASVIGD